ncbi:Uncharacterised protein [Raoultella terrigena]|uniref:Aliphatic sulfonates transport permease protein ssuC n=1 Tax=Raoultella terrigena TaxID=577 RepID=A0A4U9CUP8_RAOTE|nr:Uncharacterised protein [Raoultella terrigena]
MAGCRAALALQRRLGDDAAGDRRRLLLLALSYRYWRQRGGRLQHAGKWLALLPVLFGLWEWLTAKSALLPVPFFAPPQALIEVLYDDWPRLLDSLLHSLGLLSLGVLLGTSSGFISGLAIGWSQRIGYWLHPVLRLLGPVPSTALLPLCLFIFPSSFGASVFLIAPQHLVSGHRTDVVRGGEHR